MTNDLFALDHGASTRREVDVAERDVPHVDVWPSASGFVQRLDNLSSKISHFFMEAGHPRGCRLAFRTISRSKLKLETQSVREIPCP
ncbi:hypothetical protein [Candidatus Palauibacter sp.]|uniref:hypothetical protein n=1 Tax=Candidatus Palauibacter sp. TaxID=3101350 RepID=UPI003CC52D1A